MPEAAMPDGPDLTMERRVAESIPGLSRVHEMPVEPLRHGLDSVLSPWDLVIKPLRGGRYRYEGKGFAAIIRDDGSVQMRDHSGAYFA